MRRMTAFLTITLGFGLSLASCDSSDASKERASKSSKAKKDKADRDSADSDDDSEDSDDSDEESLDPCTPSKKSSSDKKKSEDSKDSENDVALDLFGGLALTADTVPNDVRKIFDSCTKCHRSTGFLSFAPGDFTKTDDIIRLADESVKRVQGGQGGVMPPFPAPKLSESDITTLKSWAESLKGGSSTTDTDTGTKTSTKTSTDEDEEPSSDKDPQDPCDSANKGKDDDGSELVDDGATSKDPVLNPPEKVECHAKGLAFFRKISFEHPQGRCHEATYPAGFKCNRAGVLDAFQQNSQIKDALDAKLAEGYVFDDCGLLKGKPALFLTCFHESDGKCLNPAVDKVTGSNIEITVSVMAVK